MTSKNLASFLIISLVINTVKLSETEEKLRFVTKMGKFTAALSQIAVDAFLISYYNDPSQPSNPKYTCHAIFGSPHVLHFQEVSNHLKWLLKSIDMAWSVADFKKNHQQEKH